MQRFPCALRQSEPEESGACPLPRRPDRPPKPYVVWRDHRPSVTALQLLQAAVAVFSQQWVIPSIQPACGMRARPRGVCQQLMTSSLPWHDKRRLGPG
jgi:hypothetical protein